MKTLKQEEVNGRMYRNLENLRQSIAEFLENVYNRRRLYSALGYQSPVEYERALMYSKAEDSTGLMWGKGAGCPFPRTLNPARIYITCP